MKTSELQQILKSVGLRSTHPRMVILTHFADNMGQAISEQDLNKYFEQSEDQLDRVTVYRTLKSFVDQGLLHSVLSEGGKKYALTYKAADTKPLQPHVHFECEDCGTVQCLTSYPIEPLQMPKGYSIKEAELLLKGVCSVCEKQS